MFDLVSRCTIDLSMWYCHIISQFFFHWSLFADIKAYSCQLLIYTQAVVIKATSGAVRDGMTCVLVQNNADRIKELAHDHKGAS